MLCLINTEMMSEIRSHLIESILQNINGRTFTKNDVGILLRDIRKLIEFDDTKKQFKTLSFYCDWVHHPVIARNPELYKILDKINVGFVEILLPETELSRRKKGYVGVVIEALDFHGLQENIVRFFTLYLPFNKLSLKAFNLIMSKEILVQILENLTLIKVTYPSEILKESTTGKKTRMETIEKTDKINGYIDQVLKHKDSKLDPKTDYSKSIIMNSLMIQEVMKNEVLILLESIGDFPMKLYSSIKMK